MAFLAWMQTIQNPILDQIFNGITVLFSESVLLFIACFFLWCYDKDLGYQLGFTAFVGAVFNQLLKLICKVPRPWVKNPALWPNPIAYESATGYSFPSGHTQNAVCGFGTAALYFKKKSVTIVCILAALLVIGSRLYLRVHTLWDVGFSVILNIAIVLLMQRGYRWIKDGGKKRDILVLFFAMLSAIVLILAPSLANEREYRLSVDCYKIAGSLLGLTVGWFVEKNYIRFDVNVNKKRKTFRFFFGAVLTACTYFILRGLLPVNLEMNALRYGIILFVAVAVVPWGITQIEL